MIPKTHKYTLKCHKGVDDLLPIYAFRGNSQGDESASNDIEDYKSSKGWMSFVFTDVDVNDQEAIYEKARLNNEKNHEYIKQLVAEGRYKEEYEVSIELIHNPIYDDRQVFTAPIESLKIVFLDFSKQ